MTLLLSIDPGGLESGTTGIVLLSIPDDAPAILLDSWTVPDNLEGFRIWYAQTGTNLYPDIVVCEHFQNRGIRGADLSHLLIEGVVRWIWPDARMSPAGGKNTAVPDDAMERAGFLKADFRGDHHADRWEALRHALWYLKRTDHRPTLEKMFPNK